MKRATLLLCGLVLACGSRTGLGTGESLVEGGNPPLDASSEDAKPQDACTDPCTVLDAGAVLPPRPLAPLSTATVTSQTPHLHWTLPAGVDGAEVTICKDVACTTPEVNFTVQGGSGAPPKALPAGVHFWRLRGTSKGVVGSNPSPTWEMIVGARSASIDASSGSVLDVNEDGYADVIVGAPFFSSLTGGLQLYFGGASGLSAPKLYKGGVGPLPQFGYSVASAGDVNGDGFADVIVGAPNAGGSAPGAAYLYVGSPAGLVEPPVTLAGPANHYNFGSSVASAGDVNGDGYADVVVSGWGAAQANGSVVLYLGGALGLSTTPIALASGSRPSVASAGDVNGDGYADVVVSDPTVDAYTGSVTIFLGGPSGPGPAVTFAGTAKFTEFGYAVAATGDLDGDGTTDLVVGAPGQSPQLHVLYGGPGGPTKIGTTVLDPDPSLGNVSIPSPNFGSAVASAGDVDHDGYADVIVGAPRGPAPSAAYVFRGGSGGLQSSPIKLAVLGAGAYGQAVLGAGDVDHDGYADVIVGAPTTSLGAGAAYLHRAGPNGFVAPTILTSPGNQAGFGASLASLRFRSPSAVRAL